MLGPNRDALQSRLRIVVLFAAAWVAGTPVMAAGPAQVPQLRYAVIITRHGVRSPTWLPERLNEYSAEPWPDWGVPPAYLTPYGRGLMKLMGSYYREWLLQERLLLPQGCEDAERIYIHADTDERTMETGRALAESMFPGCSVAVHSVAPGTKDPLFDPIAAGIAKPDWETAAQAARERLGSDPGKLLEMHRSAFDKLQYVLTGGESAPRKVLESTEISVSATDTSMRLKGPFSVGSTLSENLLLEYTDGMRGRDFGWGRIDVAGLRQILELHLVSEDLTARSRYLAQARGSNLLDHVLKSMEQAETGKPVAGALGPPEARLLIIVGHDTNISNISGMLGLSWHLPGDQPDDTPPGGALVFTLWQQPDSGEYSVRARYVAQTLEQMHNATPLSLAVPPAQQELEVSPCQLTKGATGCSWRTFANALQSAIDTHFVSD